jgi:glycosyltransferase involved in cell wall biosynthesis
MKRRGLMIIHHFRPGPTGGAEIQAERLAQKLVELGHPIQVLTRLTVPEALPEETSLGVKIHRADFPLAYCVTTEVENTFKFLVKRRHTFDVLHAHMAYGHAVVAVVVARSFRKKCIIKIACLGEYGDMYNFSQCPRFNWALEILHQADALVAISRDVEADLLRWGFPPERIHRIPNGVNTAYFQPGDASPPRHPVRFILMGRRHPQKGLDLALQAAHLLQAQGLSEQFHISFYGAEYPEHDYEGMAQQLGVSDNVAFFPFQKQVLDIYQTAHCLILPSRGEGLSNSLLEAMATALPVIATQVSGTVDVVTDGEDGLLIPPEAPEALAKAMATVIQQPDLARRLGQQARQKMLRAFSLDSVAQRYSELYASL